MPGSESTSTGVAPACSTAFAEATNVIAGTSTSSPGPIPSTCIASISAAVHDETQRAVRGADVLGERLFEPLHLRTGPDPSRPQRVDDLGDLGLADRRSAEDQKAFPHAQLIDVGARAPGALSGQAEASRMR